MKRTRRTPIKWPDKVTKSSAKGQTPLGWNRHFGPKFILKCEKEQRHDDESLRRDWQVVFSGTRYMVENSDILYWVRSRVKEESYVADNPTLIAFKSDEWLIS